MITNFIFLGDQIAVHKFCLTRQLWNEIGGFRNNAILYYYGKTFKEDYETYFKESNFEIGETWINLDTYNYRFALSFFRKQASPELNSYLEHLE